MAVPQKDYSRVQASGQFDTAQASIAMTPEMFELLSAGIYEDRPMAIVRELLCNGRDAMKEHAMNLGVDVSDLNKLTVHIPNNFQPFFFVRDYGTGLTHEQVFEIYLSYGKSTKTGSNEFIGMFGIGSKSPLSYTDSFVVTSFKDGVETQYNVYKDAGIPKISKLIEKPTTEPNGLKVMVAVRQHDNYTFKSKVSDFLQLFDFPVEVEGDVISKDVTVAIENENYLVVNGYARGAFALMGGVVYKLSDRIYADLKQFIQAETIILPFGIGELNIASSRENLSYVDGDATDTKIKQRVDLVRTLYLKDLQDNLDKKGSLYDVFYYLTYNIGLRQIGYSDTPLVKELHHEGTIIRDLYNSITRCKLSAQVCKKNSYGRAKTVIKTIDIADMMSLRNGSAVKPDVNSLKIWLPDRATGNQRAMREYSNKYGVTLLLDWEEEHFNLLEEMYGKEYVDAIEKVSCSAVYDEVCPKVARTVQARKVSGVNVTHKGSHGYTITSEVTELDGSETGVLLYAFRDELQERDEDGNVVASYDKRFAEYLVDSGLVDRVYTVRNSAPKRCRPDVPQLTKEFFGDKLKRLVTKKEITACALASVSLSGNLANESLKDLFKFYFNKTTNGIDFDKMSASIDGADLSHDYQNYCNKMYVLKLLDKPLYKTLRAKEQAKIKSLKERIKKYSVNGFLEEYPLIAEIDRRHWVFTEKSVEQAVEFVKKDIESKF